MFTILDVGAGPESMADIAFEHIPDRKVVRLDGDRRLKPDIVHDITKPLPSKLHGQFDIIYCSHVIEHLDRNRVIPTLGHLKKGLKNLGEIWVLVPSLEWAALQIINNRQAGPEIQGLIYGSQTGPYQYHKVGFTLVDLRVVMESLGYVIRKAHQAQFQIAFNFDGQNKVYDVIQNVVIAARYDQPDPKPEEEQATPGTWARRLRKRKR